jgi:hypothetical protein
MKTVSIRQALIAFIAPVLLLALNYLIPSGPIHDYLTGLIGLLAGTGIVSTRIPSTQGGTVAPAATIAPDVVAGAPLVEAAKK